MAKRTTDPGRLKSLRFSPTGIQVVFRQAALDRLALDFCAILNRRRIRYAVVSGYPAILLGRSRESEDVDILADPMTLEAFRSLHRTLTNRFECLTPGDAAALFHGYLDAGKESTAVRYSFARAYVPNVEFKFTKTALHRDSVRSRIRVRANGRLLFIGPLETQIAYKVWLGSPKDLEDARWIWKVAGGHLAEAKLWSAARKLYLSRRTVEKALEGR